MSLQNVLTNLFTVWTALAFMAGVGATVVYYKCRDMRADRTDPGGAPHHTTFNRVWIYGVVAVFFICWIGVRTQVTANRVEQQAQITAQLAEETQRCFNELAMILQARAVLVQQNDDLSQEQRKAIADWLRELLNPPPEIKAIQISNPNYNSDPRYVKWGLDMTQKYYDVIAKSQQQQDRNDVARASHPIPAPTCGLPK